MVTHKSKQYIAQHVTTGSPIYFTLLSLVCHQNEQNVVNRGIYVITSPEQQIFYINSSFRLILFQYRHTDLLL